MNAVDHSPPSTAHVYKKCSLIKTDLATMRSFHEDPKALSSLIPPPIFMQIKDDQRTSLTEGDIHFVMWMGPIPIRWHAQHQAGPTPTSFADEMISGPLQYWRHEHIFTEKPGGVELCDRITLAHKPGFAGLLTRLMFDGIPLRILFFYRHLRTRMSLAK